MNNELRFQYCTSNTSTTQDVPPTLQVLGAFTGGGYSDGTLNRNESHYELQNLPRINFVQHYFRFSGFVRNIRLTQKANPNFNRTFIFNSLSDYATTEQDLSQFALSYGKRFESENVISDRADWAPRLGFSWAVGRGEVNTVIRAGFGIFYKRFEDLDRLRHWKLPLTRLNFFTHRTGAFYVMAKTRRCVSSFMNSMPLLKRMAANAPPSWKPLVRLDSGLDLHGSAPP